MAFLNQYSRYKLDLEKIFLSPEAKIVLQHYHPKSSISNSEKVSKCFYLKRFPDALAS